MSAREIVKVKKELGYQYTCQKCLKRRTTTRPRQIKTKDYMGLCGDSFCYASCDMSTCHPISITCCEKCAAKLAK